MSDADQARRLLAEIAEERAKGARVRSAVTLVALGMFATFGLNVYTRIVRFDDQKMLDHLQIEASHRVWPLVSRELDAVARDAVPAISAAMAAEAQQLLPKLTEKLSGEAETFQTNMNAKMKQSLDLHLAAAMKEHAPELREKLPDLAADQALYDDLVRRLEASCRVWAQQTLDTTFEQHVHVLQSINESVRSLREQAEADRSQHGDRTVDDTLALLVEVFNAKVNGEGR